MPSEAHVDTPLGSVVPQPFPGRTIKMGDPDTGIVKAIQHRLNEAGCGPLEETGVFDEKTKRAVKLFVDESKFRSKHSVNPLAGSRMQEPLQMIGIFHDSGA